MTGEPEHQPPSDLAFRVSQAVEREERRRKRLLRFYLGLLVIPVAVAAFAFQRGRADVDLYVDAARGAAEQTAERTATAAASQVVGERADRLDARFEEVQPAIDRVLGFDDTLTSLSRRVEGLAELPPPQDVRQALTRLRQLEATVEERVTAQLAQQEDQLQRQEVLLRRQQTQIDSMRVRVDRQNIDQRQLQLLRLQVDSLDRRTQALQDTLIRFRRFDFRPRPER